MPIVLCKVCRKEFYAKPSQRRRGWGRFCSSLCQYKSYLTGKLVKCGICDKKIWRTPQDVRRSKSGKFFCGKKCQTLWRNREFSGPRHSQWKNGESIEYRERLINSGAKWICRRCHLRDKRVLVVHHLDKNRRNSSIQNLVWLCSNCHFLVHQHNVSV